MLATFRWLIYLEFSQSQRKLMIGMTGGIISAYDDIESFRNIQKCYSCLFGVTPELFYLHRSIIPVMVRCGIFLLMIILVSWHQSFIEYGEKMNISWEANYSEFEKQNIFILLSIYQLHLYFVANKSIIEYGEKMSISCETNYSWFENKTW